MFIPVAFDSVNAESDLPAGVYGAACGVYLSPDGKSQITLFEYSPQGVDSVVAADLLVLDATGAIRACDFVWLADRSWREWRQSSRAPAGRPQPPSQRLAASIRTA